MRAPHHKLLAKAYALLFLVVATRGARKVLLWKVMFREFFLCQIGAVATLEADFVV
jgi:hypothetical protein